MNSILKIKVVLLFLLTLVGCSDDTAFMSDGKEFSTLKLYDEKVYKIENTVYSASNSQPLVNNYFEKHVVIDLDEKANASVGTIMVYKASTLQSGWVESEMYRVEEKVDGLVEVKDNQPKVLLKYPIIAGVSWDENLYNNGGQSMISYSKVDDSFEKDSFKWDKTVQVNEIQEKSTLIDYINKYKVYAPSVGLVYEEDIALEYCQDSNCIGQYKIVSGYTYAKSLIN